MPLTWKPLQLANERSDIPPLLVKSEFGSSNYKVWLTDLTFVWSESLDRRRIIQRAFNIETSIDPSEDASQLRLFLKSVDDALSQRTGTSIDLVQNDDDKQIKLRTSTSLPGNLQPLEWHILLIPASQSVMTNEFTIPLLSQQLAAIVEKSSLMQHIRTRDHVIGKLVEKMQSDGVDLSKVFPGAASSKAGTGPNARQITGKSVKGLTEFDAGEWQSSIAKGTGRPQNLEELLTSVSSTDVAEMLEGVQAPNFEYSDKWWKNLRHESSLPRPAIGRLVNSDTEESAAVDDDFQTQPTPLKLSTMTGPSKLSSKSEMRGSSPMSERSLAASSSTADETDDYLQSSKPRAFTPIAERKSSNGLSSDGRGPFESRLEVRSDDSPRSMNVANGHDTTSSSNEHTMDLDGRSTDPSKSGPESTVSNHPQPSTKPKSKLGKIGGKVSKPAAEDTTRDLTPPVTRPKQKLGRIGGTGKLGHAADSQIKDRQPAATVSENHNPSYHQELENNDERLSMTEDAESKRPAKATISPRVPSPHRETDEERANKKREKLKRELESKSQAGAKKKRRF
ncbi:hypothetical protein P7C71_g1583, partial [Lecanoromycetidae sp. Uapishka_2]